MGLWCRYFSYAQESRARIAQCVGPIEEAAGTSGGKRNHEEMSHMMALVEAARKVRTITAQPCAQPHMGQMGSQCRRRKRLWPSSVGVSQDVTSVANAYRASREA